MSLGQLQAAEFTGNWNIPKKREHTAQNVSKKSLFREGEPTPNTRNRKKTVTRHIKMKLSNTNDQEKRLKSKPEKKDTSHAEKTKVRKAAFLIRIIQARR